MCSSKSGSLTHDVCRAIAQPTNLLSSSHRFRQPRSLRVLDSNFAQYSNHRNSQVKRFEAHRIIKRWSSWICGFYEVAASIFIYTFLGESWGHAPSSILLRIIRATLMKTSSTWRHVVPVGASGCQWVPGWKRCSSCWLRFHRVLQHLLVLHLKKWCRKHEYKMAWSKNRVVYPKTLWFAIENK